MVILIIVLEKKKKHGISGLLKNSSFPMVLFLMTLCLFSAGFHNAAVIVNPQDLAPKHSGSVFGIMNAFGAIPGNILFFVF